VPRCQARVFELTASLPRLSKQPGRWDLRSMIDSGRSRPANVIDAIKALADVCDGTATKMVAAFPS
jgi:hypothetical protein